MSSTDSRTPETAAGEPPFRTGFEPRLRGMRAECDGGRPIEGTHFAGRQEFTGALTGAFRDFGPYPWRWFLMSDLTRKPAGYPHEAVWCDGESLTLLDGAEGSLNGTEQERCA